VFNSNNAPKRKFRIVQKAPHKSQWNERSGRWVVNARPNAPPPARNNNEGRCYNCGKPGHFMNACSHPRQQNQGRGQNQNNKDKGKK
jgi:hypothetical protein